MVVTIDCRDTINCKVTIVLCNGALEFFYFLFYRFYHTSMAKVLGKRALIFLKFLLQMASDIRRIFAIF